MAREGVKAAAPDGAQDYVDPRERLLPEGIDLSGLTPEQKDLFFVRASRQGLLPTEQGELGQKANQPGLMEFPLLQPPADNEVEPPHWTQTEAFQEWLERHLEKEEEPPRQPNQQPMREPGLPLVQEEPASIVPEGFSPQDMTPEQLELLRAEAERQGLIEEYHDWIGRQEAFEERERRRRERPEPTPESDFRAGLLEDDNLARLAQLGEIFTAPGMQGFEDLSPEQQELLESEAQRQELIEEYREHTDLHESKLPELAMEVIKYVTQFPVGDAAVIAADTYVEHPGSEQEARQAALEAGWQHLAQHFPDYIDPRTPTPDPRSFAEIEGVPMWAGLLSDVLVSAVDPMAFTARAARAVTRPEARQYLNEQLRRALAQPSPAEKQRIAGALPPNVRFGEGGYADNRHVVNLRDVMLGGGQRIGEVPLPPGFFVAMPGKSFRQLHQELVDAGVESSQAGLTLMRAGLSDPLRDIRIHGGGISPNIPMAVVEETAQGPMLRQVYHSTRSRDAFNRFDLGRAGAGTGGGNVTGDVIFFAADPEVALAATMSAEHIIPGETSANIRALFAEWTPEMAAQGVRSVEITPDRYIRPHYLTVRRPFEAGGELPDDILDPLTSMLNDPGPLRANIQELHAHLVPVAFDGDQFDSLARLIWEDPNWHRGHVAAYRRIDASGEEFVDTPVDILMEIFGYPDMTDDIGYVREMLESLEGIDAQTVENVVDLAETVARGEFHPVAIRAAADSRRGMHGYQFWQEDHLYHFLRKDVFEGDPSMTNRFLQAVGYDSVHALSTETYLAAADIPKDVWMVFEPDNIINFDDIELGLARGLSTGDIAPDDPMIGRYFDAVDIRRQESLTDPGSLGTHVPRAAAPGRGRFIWQSGLSEVEPNTRYGSQMGGIATDAQGLEYYVKFPPAKEHAVYELLGDELYALAGTSVSSGVVESRLVIDDAGRVVGRASEWLPEHVTLQDYLKGADGVVPQNVAASIMDDFALDVLLQNRDVIGMNFDNILVDPEPLGAIRVFRVDNGSVGPFRAMGGRKRPPGPERNFVKEAADMLDPSVNPVYAEIFDASLYSQKPEVFQFQLFTRMRELRNTLEHLDSQALVNRVVGHENYVGPLSDETLEMIIDASFTMTEYFEPILGDDEALQELAGRIVEEVFGRR